MDNVNQSDIGSQDPHRKHGVEIVRSASLPRRCFRGSRPRGISRFDTDGLSFEAIRAGFRGEASIHVALIDQSLPLDPSRLLQLSWLASEMAARLEGQA